MSYRKTNVPKSTISRDMVKLSEDTNNVYQTVMTIATRANQISQEIKEELQEKLQEFAPAADDLQDTFDNNDQVEVSLYYERMPKATLIAAKEYESGELHHHISEIHKK